MTRRLALALLFLGAFFLSPARADDAPEEAAPAPPADEMVVGVITGNTVNVRVGPRIDNHPVRQLDQGDVVLIVERRRDWVGVLLPCGFPAAVSTDYAIPDGPDMLRVKADKLNLRAHPPVAGQPAPGIFLDHPAPDALLPLIELVEPDPPEEGETMPVRGSGWAWVLAPESVRVFVHERFVKEMGPLAEYQGLIDAARARRDEEIKRLAAVRREGAVRASGRRLMEVLGAVQQDLYHLRQEGGHDKAPLVVLSNRLDRALDAETLADDGTTVLGRALREDLEREIQLRVARHDAELARVQGREAPAVPPLDKVEEQVTLVGDVRYEPTPGWTEKGIYLLWIEGRPRFALRVGTGGPLPHPDFEAHAGAGTLTLTGRRPGLRLFGLPVLEVWTMMAPE